MEGWVYVIANRAMPRLVKVGMTTRTPEERARELNGTHAPYRYTIEYRAQVCDPKRVELAVHRELANLRADDRREWFRCSVERAVETIRKVSEEVVEREQRKEAERLEQQRHRQELAAQREAQYIEQARQAELAAYKDKRRAEVHACFDPQIDRAGGVSKWSWILGCFGAIVIGLLLIGAPTGVSIFLALLTCPVPALSLISMVEGRRQKSPEYVSASSAMQRDLAAIHRITSFPSMPSSGSRRPLSAPVAPQIQPSRMSSQATPPRQSLGSAGPAAQPSGAVPRKNWTYDPRTKVLQNRRTGAEYPPEKYRRVDSTHARGYEIPHGSDVWVGDLDIDTNASLPLSAAPSATPPLRTPPGLSVSASAPWSPNSPKSWSYDSHTKVLRNKITGIEYHANAYRRVDSPNVSGFEIPHGRDAWVNDFDIDRAPLTAPRNADKGQELASNARMLLASPRAGR